MASNSHPRVTKGVHRLFLLTPVIRRLPIGHQFFAVGEVRAVPLVVARRSQVRPCKHRALTTPRGGTQGCCPQRGSQYKGYRCAGSFGSGNRQSPARECDTLAPVGSWHRSPGIAVLWGESISPPTRGFLGHRVNRLLGRSFPDLNMYRLVT